MAHKWYGVHTYSGFENKVRLSLAERIKQLEMEEFFGEILIPCETVVELKKGEKKTSSRKFFPGYILVNMELNDDSWHVVKETAKVTGFVGGEGAGVTTTSGSYGAPDAGSQTVTAVLAPGDFAPGAGTLLSNYVLPPSAAGPGLITQAPQTRFSNLSDALDALLRRAGFNPLAIDRLVLEAVFDVVTPRTYIPFPAPGALSTWRNNGFGTLPIVINGGVTFADLTEGGMQVESGPPIINATEQILLQGVKDKQWSVALPPRFGNEPSLNATTLAAQ